mgnify:CR=1 FL=1
MKNQPKLNEVQHGDSIQGVYEILASHIEKGPKSGNWRSFPYTVFSWSICLSPTMASRSGER